MTEVGRRCAAQIGHLGAQECGQIARLLGEAVTEVGEEAVGELQPGARLGLAAHGCSSMSRMITRVCQPGRTFQLR